MMTFTAADLLIAKVKGVFFSRVGYEIVVHP